MRFSLTTWNINSVRLRIDLVAKFLKSVRPDVLCLQETKCPDDAFPMKRFRRLGYEHIALNGEQGKLRDPMTIHNYYVPAGGDEPDPKINPKFEHKLAFLDEMKACANLLPQRGERSIAVGDLNVAPL